MSDERPIWERVEIRNAPCKDCPDRTVDCHSVCEKYIEYSNARKAYNEHKMKVQGIADAYGRENNRRVQKYLRQKGR